MHMKCKCQSCSCQHNEDDTLETICNDVSNEAICDCKNECDCGFDEEESVFPRNFMFGQSYVPFQRMKQTFTPEVGLKKGTIFPELVSPYAPGQSMEEINYIRATNTIKEGCNKC